MISLRRAAAVATLVAGVAYVSALGNGFTLDDGPVVERNAAAHSVASALAAFDDPYWPPQHGAGLYRPLVILSFAADWQLSGGSALWLHAVNVAWHMLATALLVVVLAGYVSPAGALVGGLVFAVHPVHVESVANLVGRAEPMAAAFIFAALLLARAARRRRARGARTLPLEALMLGCVALALLSKEHAVVAIALLALDDLATRQRIDAGLPWRAYALTAALTSVWLVVRRSVEGNLSFAAVAPTFFLLDAGGRLSTMMPVVLVLVRLLVWPFDLSADYHPRVVERLDHLTAEGALGAAVLSASAILAVALWRRNRSVSVGLLVIGITWLPTANILFPTGLVISERTLYLASSGLALIVAEGAEWLGRRAGTFRTAAAALVVLGLLGVRTATANGRWRSDRDLVLYGLFAHPESYRVHQAAARVLVKLGDVRGAMAEYGVSAELYPLEVANVVEAARAAADAGDARLAQRFLSQEADRLGLRAAFTEWLHAYVLLRTGSAAQLMDYARGVVRAAPAAPQSARVLVGAFLALGQWDSARAVWPEYLRHGGSPYHRWLYGAATYAAVGMPDSARLAFDSARRYAPNEPLARADLGRLRVLIEAAPR